MHGCDKEINVGDTERALSALAGGGLLLFGLSRLSLTGLIGMAVGGALLYRGVTGHCGLYDSLEMSTAEGHPERIRGRARDRMDPLHGGSEASLPVTGEPSPFQ